MVLAHMAKHTRRDNFSCGLCGKGSNWQSVIRVQIIFCKKKKKMCPSADFSHAGNFRNLEIIWWLVFSNLKKKLIITQLGIIIGSRCWNIFVVLTTATTISKFSNKK